MKQYRVAILGASGAVGQEMMKILAERKFPVGELRLLARARAAGEGGAGRGPALAHPRHGGVDVSGRVRRGRRRPD